MEPDFTVMEVWLTEDYREGLIDVGWATKSAGFGHLSFDNKDGKIHCSSETMGRKFVKEVLNKLVDVAVFDEIFPRKEVDKTREPNTETVQAIEELEAYSLIKNNLEFVAANCTPEIIKEKVQEILDNLNKIFNVKIFDSVEALVEDLNKPSDTELLDFLQQQTNKATYTGKVICRKSTTGRGWRLLESSADGAVSDVRQAIINYMKQVTREK